MFNSYVSLPEGMLAVGYLSDEIPPLDPDFVAVLVSHSEILRDNDGNHEVRSLFYGLLSTIPQMLALSLTSRWALLTGICCQYFENPINIWLVDWNILDYSIINIYWGNSNSNWLTFRFFRGVKTTNQTFFMINCLCPTTLTQILTL